MQTSSLISPRNKEQMEQREKVIGVHKELKELKGIKKIHFVGIGGAGMSPLAKMMVDEWLNASYCPRHDRRVAMIAEIEQTGGIKE